jgi:hypothetical protein
MDMVLKIAQRSAQHGDWSYFSGFDQLEKSDYWYISLLEPGEKNGDDEPSYKLTHDAPGCKPMEHSWSNETWFVAQAAWDELLAGKRAAVHVTRIGLFKRQADGTYDHVKSLLCNTSAFILNGNGENIDRLV